MKNIKEKTIEKRLHKHYAKNFHAKMQVRLAQKHIDLVTKCPVSKEVWAIEVKIRDWKGAYHQALLNMMACNKSFVAIWHEHAGPALQNQHVFSDKGIGLMVVDSNFHPTIVVEPRESRDINDFAYLKVAGSL